MNKTLLNQIPALGIILFAVIFSGDKQLELVQSHDQILASKMAPHDHFDMMRSYPELTPDYAGINQSFRTAFMMSKTGVRANGFDEEWRIEGPGNIGARINAIAVPNGKSDTIYLGYARGGIYRTFDGGSNWTSLFDDQERLCIGSIAINPLDDAIIYAGTGDRNIGGSFSTGTGAYKSYDYGETWQYIGLADRHIISEIAVDPIDTSILYAAAMGNPSLPSSDRGLYKSIDGGSSWNQILFIGDSAGINDIAINSNNPNEIYACGWTRFRSNQASIVSGNGGKIWKSTDGGTNWVQLSNGLPTGQQGRVGISMFEPNPDTLFALYVGTNSQLEGIYRTMDGGDSWAEIPTTSAGVSTSAMGGFGWYFSEIYVNPYDYQDVFFNGVQLWRTESAGGFWSEADPPWYTYEVHADKHAMVFLGPEEFLIGTDGGLYKTTDNAANWTKIENNKTNEFYRVEHSHFHPDNYYGGMQDNGTSGGNINLAVWPRLYGGDGFQIRFHPSNEDLFYVETQNGNIAYSDDGGFSFNNTNFPDQANRTNWDTPYVLSHHNPYLLFAASHRVWKDVSAPYGSWSSISPDLTDGNIYGSQFHTISGLDESRLNSDYLYACTSDGNVWRTTNGGTSWDSIHSGLPNRYVTSVKASPSDEDHLFVTHSGYKYNDFFAHVHKSENNGNSWIDISGDLPPIAVNDIVILPGHQDSVLFIGTDAGVYGTIDGGMDWERLGVNMPMVAVLDLEFDTVNHRLVAATVGKSIMTYPLDSLVNPVDDTNTTSSFSVLLTPTDKTCQETNNGAINVSILGGTPPYSFSWSNGATTQNIQQLASGVYSLTMTDLNNEQVIGATSVAYNPFYPEPIVGSLNGATAIQAWTAYSYSLPLSNGSSYDWTVQGGILNSSTSNSANIQWNAGPTGQIGVEVSSIFGCVSKDSFEVLIQYVGIDDHAQNSGRVYPNPSNGNFSIDFGQNLENEIEVLDIKGQLVYRQFISNQSKINLNLNLQPGWYFVRYPLNGDYHESNIIIE